MTAARPKPPSKARETVGMLLTLALVLAAIWIVDAPWSRTLDVPGKFWSYLTQMADGLFANPFGEPQSEYWSESFRLMFESLQIAWIGTLVGATLSFPIAFLAAGNTAPRPVAWLARNVLVAVRAVPETILAIAVMLPIFGVGPLGGALAGAMALGVHSTGTLGKLTSEAIESIDPGPAQAAQAAGATPLQVLRHAIVPQMLPETVAFWLYRFEINIRASAVLGVLGAGGIGTILNRLLTQSDKDWGRIGIALFVVVLVTIVVDQISAAVRKRIIHGGRNRSGRPEREGLRLAAEV